VTLLSPFTIASSRLDKVTNVAIRVELRNGNVGWGEAPVLPSVTSEDQKTALEAAADACDLLVKSRPMNLGAVLAEVDRLLPGHDFASVRSFVLILYNFFEFWMPWKWQMSLFSFCEG
jgi:L-alanine-DL-glutamate epimerase-like enolase superfamily enzyme